MAWSTPDLSDQHPETTRAVEVQFRHYGGIRSFGGPIATVKCFEDNSLVKEILGQPGDGRVLVVDGGGSMRRALLGDMIAASAVKNGWAGVIIHGCIRDVDEINAMALGVKALGTCPLKTDKRGEGQANIPVQFGGVTFAPDHYVYADNNGVLVAEKALLA